MRTLFLTLVLPYPLDAGPIQAMSPGPPPHDCLLSDAAMMVCAGLAAADLAGRVKWRGVGEIRE